MIEDLKKYLINKDVEKEWYAGGQLDALRFYLDKRVLILVEYMEGGYSGECSAVLFISDKFFLWRSGFGSCSGCDALEGSNGYEYIEDTMTSVKEFDDINEIVNYLNSNNKDFLYLGEVSKEIVKKCSEFIEGISNGSKLSREELITRLKKIQIMKALEEEN